IILPSSTVAVSKVKKSRNLGKLWVTERTRIVCQALPRYVSPLSLLDGGEIFPGFRPGLSLAMRGFATAFGHRKIFLSW
ncbi:MAG: hypothetical protein J0M35_21250, partial [Candidatus Obscuribacter phosphatis]|nr:hypothetical protein [Candidatus Obscuribacter phosphatis]